MYPKPSVKEMQKHLKEVRIHIGDTLGDLETIKEGGKIEYVRTEVPYHILNNNVPKGLLVPRKVWSNSREFFANIIIHQHELEMGLIKKFNLNPDKITTEKFISTMPQRITEGEAPEFLVGRKLEVALSPIFQEKMRKLTVDRFNIEKAYEQFLVHHLKKLGVKMLD